MASANQTLGGYKFAPLLVASQQGRANQHEPACFGLSSPWSFPSRSGIPLHAVVQPWLSLQRSISPWTVPPLVPPCCAIPPRPELQSSTGRRWCRKLWGCPGNIPSTLFPGPPHSPRPPPKLFCEHHALRQSRILHAHHKSRKQDPPPAWSRLYALTSRLDERVQIGNRWSACCAFANRSSESRTYGISYIIFCNNSRR